MIVEFILLYVSPDWIGCCLICIINEPPLNPFYSRKKIQTNNPAILPNSYLDRLLAETASNCYSPIPADQYYRWWWGQNLHPITIIKTSRDFLSTVHLFPKGCIYICKFYCTENIQNVHNYRYNIPQSCPGITKRRCLALEKLCSLFDIIILNTFFN